MPSISDVFNELTQVNVRLQQLHNDTVAVKTAVDQVATISTETNNKLDSVINTLNAGFVSISQGQQALITLATYANEALAHHSEQFETMICNLEKISAQTCGILNEAHIQTGLQASIEESAKESSELLKSAHPDAALDLQRHQELQKQVEECCPPPEPEPACKYRPCDAPEAIAEPPKVDFSPLRPEKKKPK